MKNRLKETFRELSELIGVSGHEQEVVKSLRDMLSPLADEVNVDVHGNLVAVKKGTTPGPSVLICAHSDQIGFMVKNIMENGFISFEKLGQQSDRGLEGRKVIINGTIPGVIGIMPGHLQSADDKRKVVNIKDCYVDVGASSREEVTALGIEIGSIIAYQSDFMEMSNPDLICTKSVDNRINCAIIVELFRELEGASFAGTLYGGVSVQEEIGLRGAFMLGNRLKPDYAIVVDTIPAGDTPDIMNPKVRVVHLGAGPACSLADGTAADFRFNIPNAKIVQKLRATAEALGEKMQLINMLGASYLTDANNLNMAAEGIPLATLAIPRRYSHSPVELVNINDPLGSLKILKQMVLDNGSIDFDFI